MSTTVAWWLFGMMCVAIIGFSGYQTLWKFPRERARIRKEAELRRIEANVEWERIQGNHLAAQRAILFRTGYQHRMELAHRVIHGPWHTARGVVGGTKPEGTVG